MAITMLLLTIPHNMNIVFFYQVIYGSYCTDLIDQQSLGAMVDYWVSPTAVKKDFEVARCMLSSLSYKSYSYHHITGNIHLCFLTERPSVCFFLY